VIYSQSKTLFISLLCALVIISFSVTAKDEDNRITSGYSKFASHYLKPKSREKGPVRTEFLINPDISGSLNWDPNFYKRHLLLREFKKGANRFLYELESNLLSNSSKCYTRISSKFINIELLVNQLDYNEVEDDYLLDLNVSSSEIDIKVPISLEYINFVSRANGKLKLDMDSKSELRTLGFVHTKDVINQNLETLITHLYSKRKKVKKKYKERLDNCLKAMTVKLESISIDAAQS